MRSHRIQPVERTDWLLCAELALMGPIRTSHERLAHRTRDYPAGRERAAFRRRLDPSAGQATAHPSATAGTSSSTPSRLEAGLDERQLRRCRRALGSFWAREVARVSRLNAADVKHRLLVR